MINNKNFEEAKELIKKIPKIRDRLTDLEFNHSKKANVLPDFAECYADYKYDIELESKIGYDGIGRKDKKRYEIKYTTIRKDGSPYHNFMNLSPDKFDYLIGVFFDEEYNLIGSIKFTKETVNYPQYKKEGENKQYFSIPNFFKNKKKELNIKTNIELIKELEKKESI